MRLKDWADIISDELMDLIRDAEDDEVIQERIATELRKALLYGLDEVPVVKVMYERDGKDGKVSRNEYQFSAKVEDGAKAQDSKWLKEHGRRTWLKKLE